MALGEGSNLGVDSFFLLEQHATHLEVAHAWEHGALHDCAALVVLDVAHPSAFLECDLLGEPLFLEVPDSIVVCVGKEVHNIARSFDVILKMAHQMRSVSFNLLVRGDSAEDDLGELATLEWAICDSSDDFEWVLHDSHAQMCAVVDKACDVVFRHLWELLLEDALQAGEDDEGFSLVVVVDDAELDFAIALFDHCRLFLGELGTDCAHRDGVARGECLLDW